MKKICIVYGGPSSEYEVSLNTAQAVLDHLNYSKYDVYILYIGKDKTSILSRYTKGNPLPKKGETPFVEVLSALKSFDCLLLATHGEFGEDGTLQTLLEYEDIKYTGSDVYASRLCMDKYRSCMIVENNIKEVAIPHMDMFLVKDLSENNIFAGSVVKPNRKGSSVDVYLVDTLEDSKRTLEEVKKKNRDEEEFIVQDMIAGALEVSCGVLEKKNGSLVELPAIEILPRKNRFFDYVSKYTEGGSSEITPPVHLTEELHIKIQRATAKIHSLLGCRLYSRSDFLVKDNVIYYLETNTLPGLTSTSLIPQECQAAGISYPALLDFLIENV